MDILYQNSSDRCWKTANNVGIGHGGFDSMVLTMVIYWSNNVGC